MPYLTSKDRPQRDDFTKDPGNREIWLTAEMAIQYADLVASQCLPNTRNGVKSFIKLYGSKIGKRKK